MQVTITYSLCDFYHFIIFAVIPPCTPNPCLHSGVCSEVDITDYSCDCFGTHYKGKNCEIGIVNIPVIPILTVNLTSNMLYIIAFPDDYINITFIESSALKISPSSVIITSEQTSKTFAVTPKQSGKFLLTYNISGSNSAEFESPLAYVVLSIEPFSIHSPNRYFTDLGLELGLMVPGCCMPGTVSYQCATSSMATVAFTSSCNWFLSSEGAHVTDGIVFANDLVYYYLFLLVELNCLLISFKLHYQEILFLHAQIAGELIHIAISMKSMMLFLSMALVFAQYE